MTDHITTIFRRIQHLVRPAKQTANSIETGTVSQVQCQLNQFELRDQLNAPQLYGFASSTLPGTDLVILNLAGDNSNPTVIASNHQQYRPTGMQAGETQIHDNTGQSVYISQANDGTITIKANAKIILQVGSATVTLTESNLTSSVDGIFGGSNISVQNHVHNQSADSHGDTEAATDAPTANT